MLETPSTFRCLGMIFTLTILVCTPPLLVAQSRNLGSDVDNLNIRHRTQHYELAGSIHQKKLIEYGRCLEFIHAEYEKGFGDLLHESSINASSPTDKKVAEVPYEKLDGHSLFRVLILGSKKDYREFTQAYFGQFAEHTAGMFVPSAELLIILDDGQTEQTYQVLFHEAFHQFVHRYLPFAPVWLNEGLATHFGTARTTGKNLIFDHPNTSYFNIVRNVARARQLIELDKIVLMNRSDFYNRARISGLSYTRRMLAYAQAYTLVAYLVNSNSERELLRNYVRGIASASSSLEVVAHTKTLLSKNVLDRLTSPWLSFVYHSH